MANEFILTQKEIENRIFTIRDIQVMVDYHLAELYQVETKRLNEQVKRNNKRFPKHYMFQLTQKEWEDLQSQIATTEKNNNLQSQIATAKRRSLPYVFTEQGVAMLASVLNSDIAIKVSIQIIDTFIELRKLLNTNLGLLQRMDGLERKQIETDHKFEQVFK
ncbi:MAG TPA: ORF6N domain-containing protein, partial [Chitinophagaceae bacterium]|nr:ORF6N domain-containing protein [Chitinophagaceae bacterium]